MRPAPVDDDALVHAGGDTRVAQTVLIYAICRYHATGRVRGVYLGTERTGLAFYLRSPRGQQLNIVRKCLPHRSLQLFAGQGREARP
jgi:hypothetical protein